MGEGEAGEVACGHKVTEIAFWIMIFFLYSAMLLAQI